MIKLSEQSKCTDEIASRTGPVQFPQMSIEDADTTPVGQLSEKSRGKHFVDAVAPIGAAHSAPVRITPQKLKHLMVTPVEVRRLQHSICGVQPVFCVAAARENLFRGFFRNRSRGSDGVPQVGDASEAQGQILPDHARHAAAPNVANAVGDREVSMIRRVAGIGAVPAHDPGIKICRGLGVVHPDAELAAVPFHLLQSASSVGTRRGQVSVGMEAIDVATLDQLPDFFQALVGCVPV